MPPKTITSKAASNVPKDKQDADGNEIIDLTEKKTVYMTKKAPHHTEGEENSVHPKIAELFIKRGFATEEALAKKAAKAEKGEGSDEIVL